MSSANTTLVTAAMLDSMGRFISNVGVPAAIAFFILSQLAPRLDTIAAQQAQGNSELTLIAATCGRPGAPTLPVVSP